MFKNLKIRDKLFAAFGISISASVLCTVLFFLVINGTLKNFTSFHDEAFDLSKETYTMMADINALSNSVCKTVMAPNKELVAAYITETESMIALVRERLAHLREHSFSDEFTAKLDELQTQIENLEKRSGKLFDLCKNLRTSWAVEMYYEQFDELLAQVGEVTGSLNDMAAINADLIYDETISLVSAGKAIISIVGIFCLITVILVALRITKMLVTPIHQLESVAKALAQGKLQGAGEIVTYKSKDELGSLADEMRFSMDTILDNAEDVVRVYDTQYADVGADGVYFQSFTELNQDAIDGVLIADAVTCFVNYTSSKLFEKYPNLELQFGLHATSVKDKLEYIAATDPRIRIVWENCGTFPFRDYEYTPETYKQTQDFVREIADLRGENDKFGVVTKGFTGLDWHTFVHADSPVIIGQGSKKFIANRVTRKSKIWSMVQAFWISHAVQAQEMVQTLAEAKQGDLVLCALVEDGVFEENILYPVALYAQMLWNWDEDLLQMMNDVALRSYVDFA